MPPQPAPTPAATGPNHGDRKAIVARSASRTLVGASLCRATTPPLSPQWASPYNPWQGVVEAWHSTPDGPVSSLLVPTYNLLLSWWPSPHRRHSIRWLRTCIFLDVNVLFFQLEICWLSMECACTFLNLLHDLNVCYFFSSRSTSHR